MGVIKQLEAFDEIKTPQSLQAKPTRDLFYTADDPYFTIRQIAKDWVKQKFDELPPFDFGIITKKILNVQDDLTIKLGHRGRVTIFELVLVNRTIATEPENQNEEDNSNFFTPIRFYPKNERAQNECHSQDVGDSLSVIVPKTHTDSFTDASSTYYLYEEPFKAVSVPVVVRDALKKAVDALKNAGVNVDGLTGAAQENAPESNPGEIQPPLEAPTGTQNTIVVSDKEIPTVGIKIKNYKNSPTEVRNFIRNTRERQQNKVRQFVIHETAGRNSLETLYNILLDRGLSIHLGMNADGLIYQYADLGTKTTFHGSENNPYSIGLEITSPFTGKESAPWNKSINSPWSGNKKYLVLTKEQCESTYKLILSIVNSSGLSIPKKFLNFNGNVYRWGFLGQDKGIPAFGDPTAAGIISHHSIKANNHVDGSFAILYSWLRDTKNFDPSTAYSKAIEITEKLQPFANNLQYDITPFLSTTPAQPAQQNLFANAAPIPAEGSNQQAGVKKTGSEPRTFPNLTLKKIEADFAKKVKDNIKLGSKYFYVREDLETSILDIKEILNFFGCSLTVNGVKFDINTKNISYLQRVGLQINLNKDAGLNVNSNVLTDEYLIRRSPMQQSDFYYLYEVWARVFSSNKEHSSGIKAETMEMEVLDVADTFKKRTKPAIKNVKGTFINLTEIFKKYNFYGIYGQRDFYLHSDFNKSNWWVFENHFGLIPNKTTYGMLLEKLYKNNNEEVWTESNKIWNGKQFIG